MAEPLKEQDTPSGDAGGRASELAAFDREIEQHALQGQVYAAFGRVELWLIET